MVKNNYHKSITIRYDTFIQPLRHIFITINRKDYCPLKLCKNGVRTTINFDYKNYCVMEKIKWTHAPPSGIFSNTSCAL